MHDHEWLDLYQQAYPHMIGWSRVPSNERRGNRRIDLGTPHNVLGRKKKTLYIEEKTFTSKGFILIETKNDWGKDGWVSAPVQSDYYALFGFDTGCMCLFPTALMIDFWERYGGQLRNEFTKSTVTMEVDLNRCVPVFQFRLHQLLTEDGYDMKTVYVPPHGGQNPLSQQLEGWGRQFYGLADWPQKRVELATAMHRKSGNGSKLVDDLNDEQLTFLIDGIVERINAAEIFPTMRYFA